MNKIKYLVLSSMFIAIIMMNFGCNKLLDDINDVSTGNLGGYIISSESKPLANADVSLYEQVETIKTNGTNISSRLMKLMSNQPSAVDPVATVKTDATGKFIFEGLEVGTYQVRAKHLNVEAEKSYIEVKADTTVDIGILTLKNTGDISGKVYLANKSNHAMIMVILAGTSKIAVSDTDGKYKISNVPEGAYDMYFSKTGYVDHVSENVSVVVDKVTLADDVTLQIDSNYNPQGPQGTVGNDGAQGPAGLSIKWKGTLSTNPSSPEIDWAYYNSTDKKAYIWDGSAWTVLSQDGATGLQGPAGNVGADGQDGAQGPTGNAGADGQDGSQGSAGAQGPTGSAGSDGTGISWKGTLTSHPTSPQMNWAYYNSDDKKAYIWDGSGWTTLAQDGTGYSISPASSLAAAHSTIGVADVSLSWNNPAENFSSVVIRKKIGSAPVNVFDGTFVYSGSSTSCSDTTAMTPEKQYYYGIWALDSYANASTGISTSVFVKGDWYKDEASGLPATKAKDIKMFYADNAVYMSYAVSNTIYVQKYESGSWTSLGSSAATGYYPDLYVNSDGEAFVSFSTADTGSATADVKVNKYDGSSWGLYAYAEVATSTRDKSSIYGRSDGVIYVAYCAEDYTITVKSNTGMMGVWEDAGNTGLGTEPRTPNIFTHGTVAYLSYESNADPYKATVMVLDESQSSTWQVLGSADFQNAGVNSPELFIYDDNGSAVPYLAFIESGSSISVMRYNGSSWVYVGQGQFAPSDYLSLYVKDNIPYVSYRSTLGSSYKASAKRYYNSAWEQLGTDQFTSGKIEYPAMLVDSSDNMYFGYSDFVLNEVIMRKLEVK
jgi:hypothetical protein